ncbi:hypothetical protein PV518_48065 [Streptomyces sp. ND04-05B]|uniref:hypothetical protein n=1 Tax=Streptomyces sp. ND04-05B TaxID=3028693 RepID=UPI0029ADC80B|nr:hypothetical protein [Streptomyces sp. ND04-05B]MDX3069793.1 hypothetical protein [Streptomyces sp. ND04-05B]
MTGSGSTANPYVVSSQVTCDQVRPCISAGDGATYDPATGVVAARPSTDGGNNLVFGGDGGLFVPTGAATVTAGCGLTGNGAASDPLTVNTPAWPYDCPPETNGTVVTCDVNGQLRGEPPAKTYFAQMMEARDYADLAVPAGLDVVADTFTWSYTNPDPCRPVIVFLEREADVDFDLPAGAGAAAGQDTDEMSYFRNTGTSTILDQHVQSTKVFRHQVSLAPGATANVSFPVTIGRGSGGATYNRIQVFLRAMMHTL